MPKTLFVAIEGALESYPDILPAFGERSCELVRVFQSPLAEAEVCFAATSPLPGARDDLSSNTECHPLVMLQHSAATLTTLVTGFLLDSNIQLVFVRPPDVTFPAVHTLILDECTSLTLAPYIKWLPNLAHLCVRYRDHSPWDDHDHHGPGQIPGAALSAL
uniref:Structural maintenance of chromosomes protein n=1 Tax=Ganoderma boninense TaxID=34458 RepID=A0A5K1K4H0_9APHY|nr:Structural maintenance of chromosomes protein [Ganoderma boninense]